MTTLGAWHAACNRQTAVLESRRSRQFGLRPVVGSEAAGESVLPGEVWATQAFGRSLPTPRSASFPVRVGFAGRRLHLGHIGLARTAAQLVDDGGQLLLFDASPGSTSLLDGLRSAVRHYAGASVSDQLIEYNSDQRQWQHQALSGLRLDRVRRLYGWDGSTPASALTDLATMLTFFLYTPEGMEEGGVALVDAMQATHSALLPQAARTLKVGIPTLLYRRLFPSLRREGQRGSVREPSSVIFANDDEATVKHKFLRSRTGGQASVEEQRARGGDATRCSAFAVIELLCRPETAQRALDECRSGRSCGDCKTDHAAGVVSGLRAATRTPPHAGTSPQVGPAVSRAVGGLHRTPPRAATDLETAIAERSRVHPEQVVVGHGSTEVMDWLFRVQARPGGNVVATEPTFELYQELAERHHLRYSPATWDPRTFNHDAAALARRVDRDTTMCIIDVPHSVSGAGGQVTELLDCLFEALPDDAAVLLDLVYADFMRTSVEPASRLLSHYPRTVLFGSMSKAHCLLGARVGYALAAAPLADRLRSQRLPYAMDSLALAAAHSALMDDHSRQRTVQASHEAQARLTEALQELGISYVQTEANFLLMDLGSRFSSVARHLRDAGTAFRDGRRWSMPGWMQIHLIDVPFVEPLIEVLRQDTTGENVTSPHLTVCRCPAEPWKDHQPHD
ncbi:aminotransferase class I/II-fold pyridoxal phosphate-dependent enzyme [Streptomyces durbertensis]|uniref:Aminotransferase class I/II-fold pyridoxal phosphate-dependent enzyme n=1 Tax=Streptomyces durbertensis TaxID=2448886 RepID=A0ABR6EBP7_9ACTN|nr:aminotransferase class I/II-fold pyridoxal phosphate-dependent enzyme [Streptomyces durbertensis]MBB1242507.1 aminotransferase class I/II-fold pyridoxal phosphate-dependent enzyme [Streptomyces durbertensis]